MKDQDYSRMIERLRPFLRQDEKPLPPQNPVQYRWLEPEQLPGERARDRGIRPAFS